MCGIAGLVSSSELRPSWESDLETLGDAIRHRGPDSHGFFTNRHDGEVPDRFDSSRRTTRAPWVAFVHRRLSILDLSEAARQPMVRAGGKVFVTYNGEIYNFRDLRCELEGEGARFRTQSDTEVLLEGYLRWGMAVVTRLRGIFAFAIADLAKGKVYLARDHLGVKPLYYAKHEQRWVFCSELKGIVNLPRFRSEVDPEGIRKYLHYLWIPGENTGVYGINKLPPGTWMEIDIASGATGIQTYWSPLQHALVTPWHRSAAESVEYLRGELSRVVREQMVSDVPLGAFLSGGLDSSLIVAKMRKVAGARPSTYSVGYSSHDLGYDIVADDLPFAREVSKRFETKAREIVLSPDVATLLPAVVETLDEPLGDPAAISSFLICREAKQSLTVMLSGMGADEIFGGYPRQRALLYGDVFRRLPRWLRGEAERVVDRLPGAGKGTVARIGRAGKKFLNTVDSDPLSHYLAMETYFTEDLQHMILDPNGPLAEAESSVAREADELRTKILSICPRQPLKQAMLWDLLTYLPNLNLAYTDRTSMAHGVEVRVPFLDIRLVEWSLGLRTTELVRWRRGQLEGKWLLKMAAESILPRKIVWRRKAGFGAPIRSWLRNNLAEMCEELLGARGLGSRSWFDPGGIRQLQDAFIQGRADYSLQIWMLLSLELWSRRFLDRTTTDLTATRSEPQCIHVQQVTSSKPTPEPARLLCMMQLPPPVHGAAIVNQNVANSAWLASQFALDVLPVRVSSSMEDIRQVSARKLLRAGVTGLQLGRTLLLHRPDAVYFTLSPRGAAFYRDCIYVGIMKAFGVRRIYHLHGRGVAAQVTVRWKRLLYSWAFRGAWVIHLSPTIASDTAGVVTEEQILYVPNGVPDLGDHRAPRPLHSGPPRILYLSNMMRAKGPLVLLEACGRLKARGVAFEATFVGARSNDGCVEEFARRLVDLDLANHVRYLGPLYGPAKDALFRDHEVFALPTFDDAFPLVLLEAMQQQLPIIATTEGAISDIVQDCETGFLVPKGDPGALADSLETLIADAPLRHRMGESGRARYIEFFTLPQFERNLGAALAHCIDASDL